MFLFYFHAAAMSVAFVLMAVGAGIAGLYRQQRWWLNAHKTAVTAGSAAMLAGLIAAVLMMESAGAHLQVPHTWIGLFAALSAASAFALGHLQFKIRGKARQLRQIHRWCGRITLIAVLIAIFTGLLAADII